MPDAVAPIMRLWSFVFTDPSEPVLSCRVAAPGPAEAVAFLEAAAGRPLVTAATLFGPKRVIVQNMGATRHGLGLLSLIRRNGDVRVANGARTARAVAD